MNKIMNDPMNFVDESLEGILLAYPGRLKSTEGDIRGICRADAPVNGKVAVVTGGGYGHIPVFLGYVGQGLCDGVAVGNVFTSPASETIYNVTRQVNGGSGVLYLFGNYMGDGMNFDMAGEMAQMDDIPTAVVKVSDDVASAPRGNWRERRGIAGIFFAYKAAGACAQGMAPLEEVRRVAEKTVERTATFGVAFSSCTLPGAGRPVFEIGADEMEIGMGIHGEPGVKRGKFVTSRELAGMLLPAVLDDLGVRAGDRVAVLVNGLGATSREELFILYRDMAAILKEKGVSPERVFVGEFATSLEMAGASVSLLKLDDELLGLLDAPAFTPFVSIG